MHCVLSQEYIILSKMFKVPEEHRIKDPRVSMYASSASMGNNGMFYIPHYRIRNYFLYCMASDGSGIPETEEFQWEHVSISVGEKGKKQKRNPTWEEMCWVKDQFWDEEDRVVQYHPPKSEYVSCHPYTLHLWRRVGQEIDHPPSILVGPDYAKK